MAVVRSLSGTRLHALEKSVDEREDHGVTLGDLWRCVTMVSEAQVKVPVGPQVTAAGSWTEQRRGRT